MVSVTFSTKHLHLVFGLHFHLTSCSASHSFSAGLSIALMVALDLKRSEWMGPCSSKPGHLAPLLCCLLALSSWDPISITLPYSPFMGSLLFFPTAVARGGCRCGHETWAATAPQLTSSSLSSATCTPMGARALYSLQPHEDHTTNYTSLQYSGPDKNS